MTSGTGYSGTGYMRAGGSHSVPLLVGRHLQPTQKLPEKPLLPFANFVANDKVFLSEKNLLQQSC